MVKKVSRYGRKKGKQITNLGEEYMCVELTNVINLQGSSPIIYNNNDNKYIYVSYRDEKLTRTGIGVVTIYKIQERWTEMNK